MVFCPGLEGEGSGRVILNEGFVTHSMEVM